MLVEALTFQKFNNSMKNKKKKIDTNKDDIFLQEELAWYNHQKTANMQISRRFTGECFRKVS